MLNRLIAEDVIRKALLEDLHYGDVTTDLLIPADQVVEAQVIIKEPGVLCGMELISLVFNQLDPTVLVECHYQDGSYLDQKLCVATIKGRARAILKGERTMLNLIQHMSGIATQTKKYVEAVEGTTVKVVDTRKTTPNLRALEKYSVLVGGGKNHRFNLSESIMMKDNHIEAAGSITKAVECVKKQIGHTMKIEVEVETLEGLVEAIEAGADIVMLDNMSVQTISEAVKIAKKRVILEASGGVTLETIRSIAMTGVDVISVGALTHSVKALDFSMKIKGKKTL